ncbi:uncharacterized protein DC041_0006965, partial [Schistosoma bovis]
MLHRSTKSDMNDFSTFGVHDSTENTETCTLPTTHTEDDIIVKHSRRAVHKTTDTSVNDRQKDHHCKHKHTLHSQSTRSKNSMPKYSNTHTNMGCKRQECLIFNREQKTVKTVALV